MDQPKHLEVGQLTEEESRELEEAIPAIERLLVNQGTVDTNSSGPALGEVIGKFEVMFRRTKVRARCLLPRMQLTQKLATKFGVVALRVVGWYTLPVRRPPVFLVPVKISGNATVAAQKVQLGSYVCVTDDVDISPGLLCLQLRAA